MRRPDLGPGSNFRTNVRSLVRAWVITLVVVGLVAIVIINRTAWEGLEGVALSAVIVGTVLLLTGGSLLERITTLESSQWGIKVNRHRDEAGRSYADTGSLTPTGLGVLVGLPLMVAGGMLM